MRDMVLLGAGASVEAGVPHAYAMTREILSIFRSDPRLRRQAHLLSFVIGGLMFQEGIRDNDPYGGVNVEELFNAVQLLARRATLEAAPFVGSWHAMVEEFDRVRPARSPSKDLYRQVLRNVAAALEKAIPTSASISDGRDIDKTFENALKKVLDQMSKGKRLSLSSSEKIGRAVAGYVAGMNKSWLSKLRQKSSSARGDQQFNRALDTVVDERRPRPGQGRVFERTNEMMIRSLINIAWIEDEDERVGYLKPLLDLLDKEGQLTVASLNYDNCIERLTKAHDAACYTGIESWSESGTFSARNDGLFLLKLHGSIDWELRKDQRSEHRPMPHSIIEQVRDPKAMRAGSFQPAIIFGQRNKLTAEGPFLDLLRAFQQQLTEADRLTVVGYSFRDDHINEYITQWLNSDTGHRIRIIDPGFSTNEAPFAEHLRRYCGGRIRPVEETAGGGLAEVLV